MRRILGIAFIQSIMMLPQGAGAATLSTSMLNIQTTNPGKPLSGLYCQVVNVSKSPRTGTLQIFAGDGTSLAVGAYNATPPGGGTGIAATTFSGTAPITLAYCVVTVDPLSAEKEHVAADSIRASLVQTDQNGNTVAAAEAR